MRRATSRLVILLTNLALYAYHHRKIRQFHWSLGYWPNIGAPRNKNEKFLWRKIFDRNPLYRLMSDKLAVREIVRARCPGLAMAEIVWIGASADDIPDQWFRPGFIVKTNNGCNRNIFIEPQSDRQEMARKVDRWLREPYGDVNNEWNYSRIEPAAFIERNTTAPDDDGLIEVSCHVAMGKCVLASIERNVKRSGEQASFFEPSGRRHHSEVRSTTHRVEVNPLPDGFPVPAAFRAAVGFAETIGEGCDYLRVDFMCPADALYFCECTVFPMGGFSVIAGGGDDRINAAWDVRNSWFMRHPPRGLAGLYARALRTTLEAGG
jgi:hypothetical protein